jgi:DNA segregation ATPase FtsK/SpoIIIE, S-DNA-T family
MYTDFARPSRTAAPALPRGEIVLEAPPVLPDASGGGIGQALMMLPMLAGGGAMSMMFVGSGATPITFVASGLYGLSSLGMFVGGFGNSAGDRGRKITSERRDYLRYLAQMRPKVTAAAKKQRESLLFTHPDPDTLWALAVGPRLWERRPDDADFAAARVAVGAQSTLLKLVPPETKIAEDLDPVAAGALRQFMHVHATVEALPVSVAMRSFRRVSLLGEPTELRPLGRAMLAQLVALQAPDDLRVAVCAGSRIAAEWDWVKWLPHALHPTRTDQVGPLRLIGADLTELERILGREVESRPRYQRDAQRTPGQPHLVVIVDESTPAAHTQLVSVQGVTVVDLTGALDDPTERSDPSVLTLQLAEGQLELLRTDEAGKESTLKLGAADQLSIVESEVLARILAPIRLETDKTPPSVTGTETVTFAGLLGISDPGTLDPSVTWAPRPPRDQLRVPIGIGQTGGKVDLDLKESALEGMGPHGMIIGATGSGKSELLRTLVLGLAVRHSSESLNLVLVDFKGGATFLGLDGLPHVSAIITNLSDELPLVDRMYDALHGELVRRQDLLRRAGNYASLRDYEKARSAGAALDPVPSLVVVVDEFSELLTTKPEFAELFVMIGRLGRSLGVHLLLASQHLDEGRLRGLGTHLSYRIALRTFSAMESRAVIGVADAYELPAGPGNGFLLYENTQLVRFKAGYVSGPYRHSRGGSLVVASGRGVVPFTTAPLGPAPSEAEAAPGPEEEEPDIESPTVLGVIVDRLRDAGPPAHRVWLPPLDDPPALGDLLDEDDARVGTLTVPVGIVDKPFEQRRDPLWVDLSGSAGHIAVVGGPRSGKSTVVANLIGGLAATHSPVQVQCYCLDFGGGLLSGLTDLPHVGSIAGRRDTELVRRTVAELTALVDQRELAFTASRTGSIANFRKELLTGTGDGYGDVFLVIDGWPVFVQEYQQLEQPVIQLISRGLGYGVHVLLSANRWAEIRPAVRELLGTRLELRLGEPFESEINRRAAANVPERSPGRGITREGLHFLAALPRVDGRSTSHDLVPAMRGLAAAARRRWAGTPMAPPVRTLPAVLPVSELPRPDGHLLPIGLDEDALAPVQLDFQAEPHLLAFGDTESGKSNLLRLIAKQIMSAYRPAEARIVVVDYRRSLLDAVDDSHKIGYAASADAAAQLVHDIVAAMKERMPGPDLTTEQLRDRSWWHGADLFLLVDDYDLVESASGNPLVPLTDMLPVGRDIGLHLVVTRASAGASRAAFDPVLRRLRESGALGLMLSGSPDEGALFGKARPQPQPPGRGILVGRRHGTRTVQTAYLRQVGPRTPDPAGR